MYVGLLLVMLLLLPTHVSLLFPTPSDACARGCISARGSVPDACYRIVSLVCVCYLLLWCILSRRLLCVCHISCVCVPSLVCV